MASLNIWGARSHMRGKGGVVIEIYNKPLFWVWRVVYRAKRALAGHAGRRK